MLAPEVVIWYKSSCKVPTNPSGTRIDINLPEMTGVNGTYNSVAIVLIGRSLYILDRFSSKSRAAVAELMTRYGVWKILRNI